MLSNWYFVYFLFLGNMMVMVLLVIVLLVLVIMKVSTGSSYRGRDASSTVPVNCRRLQAEVIFWTTIVKSDHLSHDPPS